MKPLNPNNQPADGENALARSVNSEFTLMTSLDEEGGGGPPTAFRPQRLLLFLEKFWWIPLIALVLGLGAAFAYTRFMPPTYVSTARMWETVKLRLPEGGLFSEDVQNFVGTQTELLQSRKLRDLALTQLRTSMTNLVIPKDKKTGEALMVNIHVSGGTKSSVYTLEASSSDPAYTRAYLDALMDVYLVYKRNIRQVVSGETLSSITEQVQRSERDLNEAHDGLTSFQRTNNLAILQERGTIAGGYLARLQTQLSDLQFELRLLEAASAGSPGNDGTNASPELLSSNLSPGGEGDKTAVAARQTSLQELELLKIQRQKLSRYLRPKHPKIARLDAQIERAENIVEISHRQKNEQLTASIRSVKLKIENTEAGIAYWEKVVMDANRQIAEAERLKLDIQRRQGVYERLNTLVQNVGISRNIDQENLSILEPASEPRTSYTKDYAIWAMGGVGGLGFGLGIILLIALLDDRFTSLKEVNEKLGQVIVGQVPEVVGVERGRPVPLLEAHDERHAYAEAFRSLRSAILYMAGEKDRPKVVLITSALPHEGKSTVAANLARTLAVGGARVLLIDCDLRKGALHEIMGLSRKPGLAELLTRSSGLAEVVQTNSLPNLQFISRGTALKDCGDLLLTAGFDDLIANFRREYDYILIDSCPVLVADDVTTLAPKVDGTLMVVRSRFSSERPVREALELLHQRRARILGVVFNQADASARSYYHYNHSGYYQSEPEA